MPDRPLARARLVAQGLVTRPYDSPVDVVRDFGLMQGQEPTVFSSVALRTRQGEIAAVHEALDSGELVRAYPMRGTVFLGSRADMAWITDLCSGSTRKRALRDCAAAGADAAAVERIAELLADVPGGLTQAGFRELVSRVVPEATSSTFYRVRYLLMISGAAVYAGRRQLITPAVGLLGPGLEDRFNGDRDAAVLELATRYLRSRGPATADDFAWWSKLPRAELRRAFTRLPQDLEETGAGAWSRVGLAGEVAAAGGALRRPHLLPAFDEFILGYRDRLFAMTPAVHEQLVPKNMGVFRKPVVVDGVVRAAWRQAGGKLAIDDYTGVPNYAAAGIRRRFREFPFHRPE